MNKTLIAMTSITYAMKAKDILNRQGLYCEIERTPKNLGSGCGYSLSVKEDPEKIVKILKEKNIAVKGILRSGEDTK